MNEQKLVVIGVGGGGSNAIDRMMQVGVGGIEFAVANTDAQALARSEATRKILLGPELMHGRGAGGNPELGNKAARDSRPDIVKVLGGAAIVFVAAGMGGGTGTGSAPVIAECARASGALTVGIVTLPFAFEGRRRRAIAEAGLRAMREKVDTLVVVPNDCLLQFVDTRVSLDVAFRVADDILRQGIEGISSLITTPGLINQDLASVQSTLRSAGGALLAIGYGEGEGRAQKAAQAALASPMLDMSAIGQATNVLVNITGGPDLTLFDVREAMELVNEAVHHDASISMGAVIDPLMAGRVQMTLIAGGLKDHQVMGLPVQPDREPPPPTPPAEARPRPPLTLRPPLPPSARTRLAGMRLAGLELEMPEFRGRLSRAS